jgi:hypothetical protein
MDLLASNANHTPVFHHSYSFVREYGVPGLGRGSFEALLAQWAVETRDGQPGWSCSAGAAGGMYVPGRSVSHADTGFNATRPDCAKACGAAGGCRFWQWGHTAPDFAPPLGWCYLYATCGALTPDDGPPKYAPKYAVSSQPRPGANGTSYARERRFFLSSTPRSVQPPCDKWCMMQDLCDKARSGSTGTDTCFAECIETNGRKFV